MYSYRTETRWGLLTFKRLLDAIAFTIGDIVMVDGNGASWYYYRDRDGVFKAMRGDGYVNIARKRA